jgi:hypothetical protein
MAGVCLASVILPSGTGQAQDAPEPPRFELGLRFGAGASVVRFQDPNANEQTELTTTFHLGVGAARLLGRFFEVEGSLLLSQGGFNGRGGHPANLESGYLETPLLFRARLPWTVSPHLSAGLVPRFLLRCRLTDVGQVGETGCDDPVVGTDWKVLDLAALAGVGIRFGLGRGTAVLEGLALWGLRDIKADPLPPGWARSADLRLSASFRLPVGE